MLTTVAQGLEPAPALEHAGGGLMGHQNPPAFPRPASEDTSGGTLRDGNLVEPSQPGMTLRDYFAGQALAAIYRHADEGTEFAAIAKDAYNLADAMLVARNGGPVMRLESISLTGVLRFPETVTVDFRDLPPGLIALVGGNGQGKTSLLEAWIASLYRHLPSRADRSLVDVAHGKDSAIETTFAIDGTGVYRSRVAINAVSRSQEAVLTRQTAAGPEILTDGKVTTFDAYVREHFPSLDVVLASSFAAQNRSGSFILRKPKERKQLFMQLLGVEHVEAMGETATRAARLVDEARQRVVTERDVLARDAGPDVGELIAGERARINATVEEATRTGLETATRIGALQLEQKELAEQATQHREAAAQATALVGEREQLARHLDHARQSRDQLARDQQEAKEAADREATRRRADVEERIQNNRTLLDQAGEIRAAAATAERLRAEVADAEGRRPAVDERIDQARADLGRIVGEREAMNALRLQLAHARRGADLLDHVPCRGAGEYAGCQFLADAQAGAAQIADLEARVAQDGDLEHQQVQAEARLRGAEADRRAIDETVAALQTERRAVDATARYIDRLDDAESRVASLTADLDAIERDRQERHAAADRQASDRTAALDRAAAEHGARLEALRVELDAATRVHETTRTAGRATPDDGGRARTGPTPGPGECGTPRAVTRRAGGTRPAEPGPHRAPGGHRPPRRTPPGCRTGAARVAAARQGARARRDPHTGDRRRRPRGVRLHERPAGLLLWDPVLGRADHPSAQAVRAA